MKLQNEIMLKDDLFKVISGLETIILELQKKELTEYNENNLAHGDKNNKAPFTSELMKCYNILTRDATDYYSSEYYKEFKQKLDK